MVGSIYYMTLEIYINDNWGFRSHNNPRKMWDETGSIQRPVILKSLPKQSAVDERERRGGSGSQSMLTSPTAETVQTSQHPNASLLVDRTSYLSYGFSYLQWVDIIIADATHMLTSLKLAKAPFNGSNSEEREKEERKSKTMGAFWWGRTSWD